jgi:acyl carrier protein
MNDAAIWSRLTALCREIFEDDAIVLGPGTTAADIEGWDSLTNVQLMVALEKAFAGLRFSTGELAGLRNAGDLVAAIKAHLAS